MNKIEILNRQKEFVVNMRREFHENPELSSEEVRTSKRIKEELSKTGIEFEDCAGTGVIAIIRGKSNGKTVALRADIDALPVLEENDVIYKSKNPGVMHACGHDGHAAMLLGAARALYEVKNEICGNVKFLFQPAEETLMGAKKMIEDGALEDVDVIFGQHLWNDLETGKINIEQGPRMASGDIIEIFFHGKGGHAALPNQTVDPLIVASSYIINSESIISREKYPNEPMVYTIGEMKCGTRYNIISDKAVVGGTLRCFSEESRMNAHDSIKRYADSTASMYRARAEVSIIKGTPVTINDEKVTLMAQKTAKEIVGAENLVEMEKATGSEDMAYYLSKIPGAIAFVGSAYKDTSLSYPHHNPNFDINEDSLAIGTSLYFNFAIDYLNDNK